MTSLGGLSQTQRRRASILAAIILLQALCGLFFVADVMFDLREGDHLDDLHTLLEAAAAISLLGGMVFLMLELRKLLERLSALDIGMRAARGEMASLIESFFEAWKLTTSERDVALLILKGLGNEDIARLRGTAAGTVRAQSTRIYAKAGVEGRAQLLSLFMEELLTGDEGLQAPS